MKPIFFFLLLLFPFVLQAQTDNRGGWYAGIGFARMHYKTSWYYYRYDGIPWHDNYPIHSINSNMITLSIEKKSLFKAGPLHFDLSGDLLLGISGKAKGEWLPDDDVISGGGKAAGINVLLKAVYPLPVSGKVRIAPFVGLGPQFTFLHNNGKDAGEFGSLPYLSYTDGWNEYVLLFNGAAGVNFEFSSITITPAFHFGLVGTSFTDWGPNEDGVQMESMPVNTGVSVKVGFRLGR